MGCQRGNGAWQVGWEPDHIGPQSRVPAFPLAGVKEHQGASRVCRGHQGAGKECRVVRGH